MTSGGNNLQMQGSLVPAPHQAQVTTLAGHLRKQVQAMKSSPYQKWQKAMFIQTSRFQKLKMIFM